MMKLADIPELPFALDVRINRILAAEMRAPAREYSLWPNNPFGASADVGVWPSAFQTEGCIGSEWIPMKPGQSPQWDAFGVWQSLDTLLSFIKRTAPPGELIALAIDKAQIALIPDDVVTSVLCRHPLECSALEKSAELLGYDIVDKYLQSAIFDTFSDEKLRSLAPQRTAAGLIALRADADKLLPVLEQADPGSGPLLVVAVYSLGGVPSPKI